MLILTFIEVVWDGKIKDQDSLKVSLWLNFVPALNCFPCFSIEDLSEVKSLKIILQMQENLRRSATKVAGDKTL